MNLLIVFCAAVLGLAGCAPLTQPEVAAGPQGDQGAEAGGGQQTLSAVERYQRDRALLGDSAAVRPYVAVLPFVDDSGFRSGVWDLQAEMPRLLSRLLRAYPDWYVVPQDAVFEVGGHKPLKRAEDIFTVAEALEAELMVGGRVLDYNLERLSVGEPLIGGYKSYKGTAEIELIVWSVHDQTELGTVLVREENLDRDVGLDLLGKPRDQDVKFATLNQIEFGSSRFDSTAIGQATLLAMDGLIYKLADLLRPSGLKLAGEPAAILSVHGDEVFVNIGSENGLKKGFRFEVYPNPERVLSRPGGTPTRVGVVEIQDIIGARLARVRVLEGGSDLVPGDRLKFSESE